MINSYPWWKYFIVFLVFIIGCVYSIPSLYRDNFEVSITTKDVSDNQNLDDALFYEINQILINNKINKKSIIFNTDTILIYFFSEFDQLYAYEILRSIFENEHLISYKKLSLIPHWLSLIKAKPIKLGLDLQGGFYLVLRADMTSILNNLQSQYLDTLKSVLFDKNISYIQIYKTQDYGIELLFNNSNDRDQAISYFSAVCHNLILHAIDNCKLYVAFTKQYIHSIYEYTMQQNATILKHRAHQLNIVDPVVQRYGIDRIIMELPGVQNIDKIKSILGSTTNLEFRLVNTEISKFEIDNNLVPEDSEIKLDYNNNFIPVYKQVILTGTHIINSNISFDEYHRPQINIFLDNFGSNVISKFTKNNIGKIMATVFVEYKDNGKKDFQGHSILERCDQIINIATIQSQLVHNFCIIGISNLNEVRRLSSLLKLGSLAAPLYIEEERIIGPILGRQNIIEGIIACILGILVSILFMILWYHYFGLIAGAALIVNLILIISLMSIIPGVMLTMPNIAGIVLTLSVAIDSNVLINERIKEEIKQGRPIQYAIYTGYRKAFTSIIDANITTIIISIILYIISTGPIQGFAITTIIGVCTSMFTSIIGTRALVNLIYGKKSISKLSI